MKRKIKENNLNEYVNWSERASDGIAMAKQNEEKN